MCCCYGCCYCCCNYYGFSMVRCWLSSVMFFYTYFVYLDPLFRRRPTELLHHHSKTNLSHWEIKLIFMILFFSLFVESTIVLCLSVSFIFIFFVYLHLFFTCFIFRTSYWLKIFFISQLRYKWIYSNSNNNCSHFHFFRNNLFVLFEYLFDFFLDAQRMIKFEI